MVKLVQVTLVFFGCWCVTVNTRYVLRWMSNDQNGTQKSAEDTTYSISDVNNFQFGFPGILAKITKLEATITFLMMELIIQKPSLYCELEMNTIECGGSDLLELWNTGSAAISRGYGTDGHRLQVGDIYGHNVHRTCARYGQYRECLLNREPVQHLCMSQTHAAVEALYDYICQPNATQELSRSGECMSELTTERIMSHIGEPCWADYDGFDIKVMQALSGAAVFSMPMYTDIDVYYKCYIPGILYYCGEEASRLYKGLVLKLETVWVSLMRLHVHGFRPVDYQLTIRREAEYYNTKQGFIVVTNRTYRTEAVYRTVSRGLGSCSASAILARMGYCTIKCLANMNIGLHDMMYACGPYGTLTQFIDCFAPATSHCALSIDYNIPRTITKICAAFRSASTSDYCQPILTVGNKYLRTCNMALNMFGTYVVLLDQKITYSIARKAAGHMKVGNDRHHIHCLNSARRDVTEEETHSPGCDPDSMTNILAGIEALSGVPKLVAGLYNVSYEERCAAKILKC